jgi:hypothetical protein
MTTTTRVGLKVFDPLEIVEADRLRRDVMLVDRIAFDEQQLQLARNYAEWLCVLNDKDPTKILGKFDQDWAALDGLGRLEHVSLREARPPSQVGHEIERLEQVALRELEKKRPYRVTLPDGRKMVVDPLGSYTINSTAAAVLRARCLAQQAPDSQRRVIPFVTGRIATLFDKGTREASVLRVVLPNLPLPDPSMPMGDIVAFASDPDVAAKLSRLRSWMVDMAVSPMTEEQIQTKLEGALADYREYIAHHTRKTTVGTIELLVTTTAEALENLVRLKFSALAKTLFQLFREDCSLTEAELTSPGRELAFIDAASALVSGAGSAA